MKKVILAILDGVGYSPKKEGNALVNAKTPNYDRIIKDYPTSLLEASGKFVGLPEGQMGNSEVGHLTIGSGRIIKQSLERINYEIETGSIYDNKVIKDACLRVKNKGALHIFGLISDGGVHSHINHILALIDIAKKYNVNKLYVHAVTDGRDTLTKSGIKYLEILNDKLKGIGSIATLGGRYYYMDRDNCLDRTALAYDAMVKGLGERYGSYKEAMEEAYKETSDEFIKPCVIDPEGTIKDGDSLLIANFRPDRLVQIVGAFVNNDNFKHLKVYSMAYIREDVKTNVIFKKETVKNTLTEILSKKGYRILRVAEESKWAHTTHFFNGDKDIKLKHEKTIIVPKKDVATYDLAPEMSAKEITDVIEENIKSYDFVVVNYANGDMVGHTGNYDAALIAMETIDKELGRLEKIAKDNNFLLIITADHGNVEEMIGKEGILTYHTNNKVYFTVCDNKYEVKDGSLSDVAPSILSICNIKSKNMTGNIIIKES
jgi:2,3-bisphosphoglycerate-independent phosphoglycerate mutase